MSGHLFIPQINPSNSPASNDRQPRRRHTNPSIPTHILSHIDSPETFESLLSPRPHEKASTPNSAGGTAPLLKSTSSLEFHNFSSPFPPSSEVSRITVISDESSHMSADSTRLEQPPATAAEILDTIEKRLCIMAGGIDKKGRLILCIPAQAKEFCYDADELRRLILYLADTPPLELKALGFIAVVDARHSPWTSSKLILHTLKDALSSHLLKVYLLQPDQFWKKKQASIGHSKEKTKLPFETILLSSLEKLARYLDLKQLPAEMGGTLPYDHSEWIKLRLQLEHLIASHSFIMDHFTRLERQITHEDNPRDIQSGETVLERQRQLTEQIHKSPQGFLREADDFLERTEQSQKIRSPTRPQFMLSPAVQVPYKQYAAVIVRKLIDSMQRRQFQLSVIAEDKTVRLEHCIKVHIFENTSVKLKSWLIAHGEENLSGPSHIGESSEESSEMIEILKRFKEKVVTISGEVRHLSRVAQLILSSDPTAPSDHASSLTKLVGNRMGLLHQLMSQLANRIQSREKILNLGISFNQLCEELKEVIKHKHTLGNSSERIVELSNQILQGGQSLLQEFRPENFAYSQQLQGDYPRTSLPPLHYSPAIEYTTRQLEWSHEQLSRANSNARRRPPDADGYRLQQEEITQAIEWVENVYHTMLDGKMRVWGSSDELEQLLTDFDNLKANINSTVKYCQNLITRCISYETNQPSQLIAPHAPTLHFRLRYLTQMNTTLDRAMLEYGDRLRLALDLQLARINVSNNLNNYKLLIAAGSVEAAKQKELVTNDLACTTGTATFLQQQLSLPLVSVPPSILPHTEYRLMPETDRAIVSLLTDLSNMQSQLEAICTDSNRTFTGEGKEDMLRDIRDRRSWISDIGLPGILSLSRWGQEQEKDNESLARFLQFEKEHFSIETSVLKLLKNSQLIDEAKILKEEWSAYSQQFSIVKSLSSNASTFYRAMEHAYSTATSPVDISDTEPNKQLRTYLNLRSILLSCKSECQSSLDKLMTLTDELILLIGKTFGVTFKHTSMLLSCEKIEDRLNTFELEWRLVLKEIGMEPFDTLIRNCNDVLTAFESYTDEFGGTLRVGNSKEDVKQLTFELSGCVKNQEKLAEDKLSVEEMANELLKMHKLLQSHEKSRVELLLSDICRAKEELNILITGRESFIKECSLFHSRYSALVREIERLEQTLFKPQSLTVNQSKDSSSKIQQISASCQKEVNQFLKFTDSIHDFPSTETLHIKNMQHRIESRLSECQKQLREKGAYSKQEKELEELTQKARALYNWYLDHMGAYLQNISSLPCTKHALNEYSLEMTTFQQQILLSKESEHETLQNRAALFIRSLTAESDRYKLEHVSEELKNIHKKRTSHFNDLQHLAHLSTDILSCCEEVSILISDIDEFCQTADSSSIDVFQEYQARFELSQSCITKLSSLFEQFSSHPAASLSPHESADIQCMKALDTFRREVLKLKVHFNQVEHAFLSCERSFQTLPSLDNSSHRELELLRDVISQVDGDLARISRVFPLTLADTQQALNSVTSSQSALSSINRVTLEKSYSTSKLNTLASSLLVKYNTASDFSLQLSNILNNLLSFLSATESCRAMLQNLLTQVNANKALPSPLRIERVEKSISRQLTDKSDITESVKEILTDKQLSQILSKLNSSTATVQQLFTQLKSAIRLKTESNGEKLSLDQVDRFELEAFQMIDSIKLKMDDIPDMDLVVQKGLLINSVREQLDGLTLEEDFIKMLIKSVNHLLMTGNSIISTGHPKWLRVERLSEQVSATLKEFKDIVTSNKQRLNLLMELSSSLTDMREWCNTVSQLTATPLPVEHSRELIPLYHKTEACLNSAPAHLSLVETSLWLAQQIKVQQITEIVLDIKVDSESLFELLKSKRDDIQAKNLLSESSPPLSHTFPQSETSQGDSSAPNTVIMRHTSSTSSQESKSSINTVEQDYALKFINYVIKDLLFSEAAYVQHLKKLVQVFIPYFSQTHITPVSLQGQISALFANIQELYSLHSNILSELEAKDVHAEDVCHAFASREKEFWAYFIYMKNSFQSQKLIEKHDAKVWQHISQVLNTVHPLQFYLLQPLQRIPKYQILIKDLLDYAIASRSPHASSLDSTLNLLHWIPTCADNALHWSFLDECTQSVNEKDILLQDAFYATFGFKEKNAREYRIFMTSEHLLFCDVIHQSHSNNKYIFKDAFKLSECFLTFCYVDVSSKFRVSTFSKPVVLSYSILAKTPEIKNKWVEGMIKLLAEFHGVLLPIRDNPSKAGSPPPGIFEVTANFEPTSSGLFLKLVRGQKVRVLNKSQGDVWLVSVVGSICEEGLIPSSHLREIPVHKPSWASSSVFSESAFSQDPSVILSSCQLDYSHLYTLLSDYSIEDDNSMIEETCPFKSGDRVMVLDTESDATLWLVGKLVGPFELEPEKHLPYLLLVKAVRPSISNRSRGLTHNSEFSPSPQNRVKGRTIDSNLSENDITTQPEPCNRSPAPSIDTLPGDEQDTEQEVTDQQWERLKEQASYLHLSTSPAYSVSEFPQQKGSRCNSSPLEHQSDTMMVNVLKDFEADESDLLTVHLGSRLEVLYTEGTGWVMCRSLAGEEGLVPDSCLELSSLEDSLAPTISHKSSLSQPVTLSHNYVKSYDSQDSSVPSDFPVLSQVKSYHTSPDSVCSGEYSAALNAPNLTALEKSSLVIDELVSTEQEYVQDLTYSLAHYPEAFNRKEVPKQLQTICTELFELVSRLHSFHRNIFLPVLRMCQSHPENLGECFTSQRESLKLYIDYIEQKHLVEGPMREYSSQIEELDRSIPKKAKQTLADYLIRPVHRITKYPLILQDMLKYSIRADQHLPKIEAAVDLCKEILRQANTRIHFLMLEFEHKQSLELPCILSDSFLVQVGNRHALKERQVFLFPKTLLFSKKKQFPSGKENYYLKDFLQCSDYTEVRASSDHPNTIELTAGERILLKCKCTDSHNLWLDSLTAQFNSPPLEGPILQHLTMTCRKGLFRVDSFARRRAFSLNDPPRVRHEPSENRTSKLQSVPFPKTPSSQYQSKPTTSLLAPRIVQLSSEHEFWILKPLTITCRFASNPPPCLVQWAHGDTQIISESQETVLIVTSHVSSKLRIDKCDFSHSGSYTCYVKNEVGEISKSTQVTIRGPPTQPTSPQTTKSSTHSVKLKWTPPSFDGNSPLISYVIESHSGDEVWSRVAECPSSKTSTTIKNLSPKLIYQFRVIAANKLGSSEPGPPSLTVSLYPLHKVLAVSSSLGKLGSETEPSEDEALPFSSYTYSKEIGRGRFAVVYTCCFKGAKFDLAAKIERVTTDVRKPLQHEASILTGLKHPNIVELIEFEQLSDTGRLILELVSGEAMLDRIVSEDLLTEAVVVRYLHQILLAVLYLHDSSIAHNDLRPSNILTTSTEPPQIKLADFGSAFKIDNFSQTIIPLTTEFTSPEALEDLPLSGQVDLWALGVICYIMLTGVSPFFAESHEFSHTAYNILTCNYSLQESVFQDISQEAQDFIQQLLVLDSQVRLTANGCLSHPWVRELTQSAGHSPWPMPQLSKHTLKQLVIRLHKEDSMRATKDQFLVLSDGHLVSPLISELKPAVTTAGDVTAELNKSINLTFFVSGDPTPNLSWELNSVKISEDNLNCPITYREGQAVISIDEVEPIHQSVYTCVASNRLGTASASVRLMVEGAPAAPLSPQAILITQKKALISWQGSVEKLESVSYSLERLGAPDGKWELLAENLETTAFVDSSLVEGSEYQYRVYSSSKLGISCPSVPTSPLLVPGLGVNLEEESELVFKQNFILCGELTAGRSADIKLCKEKLTGHKFVAKFIPITSRSQEDFKRETDIHKELIHPRVVQYNSRFFTPSSYILVLEHMPAGNLLQYLSLEKTICTESQLISIISQLIELIVYLSSVGVVHCNLEPECLLVGERGDIKVTDFSLSRRSGKHVPASSLSLSARGFVAPEVLRGACVSSKSDIWTLGCLCILLTTGTILSNSQTGHEPVIREKCQLLSSHLSIFGQQFVEQALVINPTRRMTAEIAATHPWFTNEPESPNTLLTHEQIYQIITDRNYL
ncbi:Kalirin-like isoform X8 [Oopsacas minuta]|uniref:non-specific serine/threonine protein kinase n=1 Tax=Oopsacas minuta TaxID=111878 RepID=A0AAV7JTD1_9METZ|nr:Kalirin-like isoform X8 [Oopsacas minuta]